MLKLKNIGVLSFKNTRALYNKPQNNFNDLLKQPIYSFSQNSFINLDIELIKQLNLNWGFSWTTSIILASGGLKLFLSSTNYIISKMKLEHPENRPTWKKFQEMVFFKDIEKDAEFYKLNENQVDKMKKWYSLNNFVSAGVSGFVLVNWFRALHFMCFSSSFFENISSELVMGIFPLITHDPYFILPIVTFFFNYFAIAGSKHPYLIHFNKKENLFGRFNRIFALSLPAIFLPSAYLISWCSFLAVHITLRKVFEVIQRRKEVQIQKKYTIDSDKIQQIQEYYKRFVNKNKDS